MMSLGLPHWLMIVGTFLVLAGFIGFALSRNKEVKTDTAAVPGETNKTSPDPDRNGEPKANQ
ncbi:hypothetical protein [Bradyrhizobium sp. CB3481]|uniref:hypothetical protein n=1 Tax=Bradyrhizobium sp. CB3481 TaxID=3039158 RepID=UPI0024B1B0B8|nr:hypothetical protein [Bradyrhizobium sp. CB3481]WFU14389.1 hypothetical protein QA643_24700 [Bradyrhizobium sp. CB3481]